jgi:hypothetical protein
MDMMNAINTLDLDHVTKRMETRSGYEQQAAVTATDLYRKFLYLKVTHPNEILVPPRLVDEAWHEHILSTSEYTADCLKLCGAYIHHNPDLQSEAHHKGWARTKALFASEFGVNLEQATEEGLRIAGRSA